MRYRVLGPVMAADGREPAVLGGPKARAVLALLLVDAGRVVTDRRLIEGIWGPEASDAAQHAVQNHVSRLRQAIDDDIVRDGGGYRLDVDPAVVDAHRFTQLVASGRERLSDAPASAALLLRDALALWHGEPFADLADVPGLQQEIRRLNAARLAAVEDRVQADLDAGRHAEVAAEVEVLIREHPFRERLYGMHMVALYRAGRQADALNVFQRVRQVLSDELGIDPSPDLSELHRRILSQDPALRASIGSASASDASLPVIRGFELREHVGDGDFGRTHRAYHAALGREVALKVLDRELSDLPDVVRGFDRRVQQVAQLDHPHIVPILDSWRDPGAVYLVTPWVRAGNINAALRHGPWSPSAMLRMLEQVGGALDLAHRRGVVHGDLKTSNILLSADGTARLSDFAVTPRLRDALGAPRTNALGVIAPEQRLGAAPSMAGDVYGLGAVAIEVLSGTRVQPDAPATGLRDRADLPADLVAALAAATSPDAAQRPARITDLVRLARRALGADVVAPAPAAADDGAPVRNPYKGLHAFTENDVVDFFGRAAVVDRVIQAVAEHPLIALVGPSGSGKSSIVRAGVIPSVRSGGLPGSERWLVTDAYPGSHPFEELAVALLRVSVDPPDDVVAALTADDRGLARVVKQLLPGDDAELLLVIDQFEELFSLTPDAAVRQAFLDSLVALGTDARGRVRTIVTLRADFFDRPLEHHGFGDLVQAGLVSVAAPSRDELAQAVAAPARNVGVQLEPGLIDRIVDDVVDQPGGLPLLQYALTELFARRDGLVLTAQAYDDTGGVRGALGRRAEELYAALPASRRAVARQVFLRLVTVDEHAGQTRRRAHRTELIGLADERSAVDDVLQRFGAHRLLTFDHDPVTRSSTVEVAHEALLSEWGRLRRWIADRRDDLLVRRRLATETAEWLASDRDNGFLVGGARLETFMHFVADTDLALDADERAFVAASQTHAAAVRRQRRRTRAIAVSALGVVVLLVIALLALTFVQRGRDTVRAAVDRAASLAAASRSAQTTDADLAVMLARQAVLATRAVGEAPTSDALGTLHEAVVGHRLDASVDVGTFVAQMVGPDTIIALSTDERGPTVWDTDTGAVVRELEPVSSEDGSIDAALSPDGRLWAESYSGEEPTIVWDVASGDVVQRLPAVRDGRDTLAFDDTGTLLAIVDFALSEPPEPNVVRVYDVATGEELQRMTLAGRAGRIAISPDGRWLAAPSAERPVVEVFEIATGRLRDEIAGPESGKSAGAVAFDPLGGVMAVTFVPGLLELHDVDTGELVTRGTVDTEQSLGVCYSGDGGIIAVTSFGRVDVVDSDDGTLVTSVHDAAIAAPAGCGPDPTRVVTGTFRDRARLWDVGSAAASEVWSVGAPGPLTGDWVNDAIVTMHADGRLRRYLPGSGLTATSDVATPSDPYPLATDDRDRIATMARERTGSPGAQAELVVRDATTLEIARRLPSMHEPQAFDADGVHLLGTSFDAVEVLDAETGDVTSTLDGDWSGLTPPAGQFLAGGGHVVADDLNATYVFDLESGRSVGVVCAEAFVSRVAVSPVGDLFAVDGPRGVQVYAVDDVLEAGPQPDVCERPDATAPLSFVADTNVRWMAFGPDGTQLATVSENGTVSLWEPRSGEPLFSIHHDGDVGGGTFSDDGRHLLVTVDGPGGDLADAVRVYTLDVDELLEIANAKVTRELTPKECAGYGIADPCGAPE